MNGGHLRDKGPLVLIFRSNEARCLQGFRFSYECTQNYSENLYQTSTPMNSFSVELDGPDPCESEPCQNGGTCERLVDDYRCLCDEGYVGNHCEMGRSE